MKKYYTVYKTTNIVNGKFYIGAHQTTDLQDDYLGSGVHLRSAIRKYGRDAFVKEYLAIFDDPAQMWELEGEIVCDDLVENTQCYNLVRGGHAGGFETHNRNPEFKWARSKGAQARNAIPIKDEWRDNLSTAMKKRFQQAGPPDGWLRGWSGKTHSDESKKKMSEIAKERTGDKNSQYGTAWIHSEVEKRSRKVKKDEVDQYLTNGWKIGRKMKFVSKEE